jgi:serine/threonine-protein kinase
LERLGFRVKFDPDEPDPKAAKGTVIWQDPAPGTVIPKGSTVLLTPSSGPPTVPVPDVVGMDEALARKVMEASGLKIAEVDSLPASAEPGVVIATRPSAGVGRDLSSDVSLVLSRGPAEINVPDVIGMSRQQASDRLEQAGLKLGAISSRPAANRPVGVVIEQRPAPGTLSPRDGRVDIIVSRKTSP